MNLFWFLFITIGIIVVIILKEKDVYENYFSLLGYCFTIIGMIVDLIVVAIICSVVEIAIMNIGKPEIEHKVEVKAIYSIENNGENFVLGTGTSRDDDFIRHYYYIKNDDGTYKAESTTANKIELNDNEIPQLRTEWDECKDKNLKFWFINWEKNKEERFILPSNTIMKRSGTDKIFTHETIIGW